MNPNSIVNLYKAIILRPDDFFKGVGEKDSLVKPLVFAVINSVLMFAVSLFSGGMYSGMFGPLEYALSLVFLIPLILLFVYLETAILHLVAKLFKGKGAFKLSLFVVCYTSAVSPLTALPYIGLLISLYGVYLTVVGFEVVHKLKRSQAAAVVLIPFIVVLLVISFVVTKYENEIRAFIERSGVQKEVTPIPEETGDGPTPEADSSDYSEDYTYPTGYEEY